MMRIARQWKCPKIGLKVARWRISCGQHPESGDNICPGKDLSGAAGCESAGWRGLHVLPLGKGAERGAGDLSDGKGSGGGCAGGI